MSNKKPTTTAKSRSKSNIGVWLLVILFVVTAFFGIMQTVRLNDSKAPAINGGVYDGDVLWLNEMDGLPVVEQSNDPAVVVVPIRAGDIAGGGSPAVEINPFAIDIAPMAGSLTFTQTTSPSSLTYSELTYFWINNTLSKNLTSNGAIILSQADGLKVKVQQSDTWGDGGETIVDDWYLYYSKDGGTWYKAKSNTANDEFNFASMGRGSYQFCAYNEYSIDYGDGSGATVTKTRSAIYTVAYDIPEEELIIIPDAPAKEGYTFIGWYLDEQLQQPLTVMQLTEDITLYAKYEINKYTITFETNGGSTINAITVNWNTVVYFDTHLPTRYGHEFLGWYSESALENEIESLTVVANKTVYAKWEVKKVSVTFIADGVEIETVEYAFGTFISSIVSQIEAESQSVVVSISTAGVAYDDYTEAAKLIGQTNIYLTEKSLDEKVKGIDWILFGYITASLLGLSLIILVVVAVVRNQKEKNAPAPAKRKAPAKKNKK